MSTRPEITQDEIPNDTMVPILFPTIQKILHEEIVTIEDSTSTASRRERGNGMRMRTSTIRRTTL
jgi:hypothetical protein